MARVFLTAPEAANFLGIAKSYLYKLVMYRSIPFYKPTQRRLLFDRDELEQWLLSTRVDTAAESEVKAARQINALASQANPAHQSKR